MIWNKLVTVVIAWLNPSIKCEDFAGRLIAHNHRALLSPLIWVLYSFQLIGTSRAYSFGLPDMKWASSTSFVLLL